MALLKNIKSTEGFVTSYHKIQSVALNDNILHCHVDSYVSKEYRNLERPAQSNFYSFEITVEEEESMGIRQLAYSKLKELPEWTDAENI